jgi:hypothetical protein
MLERSGGCGRMYLAANPLTVNTRVRSGRMFVKLPVMIGFLCQRACEKRGILVRFAIFCESSPCPGRSLFQPPFVTRILPRHET